MGASPPSLRRTRAAAALICLGAMPLGCDECGAGNLTTLTPSAVVDPTSVAFGTVFLGAEATREVAVRNIGGAPLTVVSTAITGEGFTAALLDGERVEAGAERTVSILFKPETAGWHDGALTVETDDEDALSFSVPLTATAAPPLDCDDGSPCTEDLFDPFTGTCSHAQLSGVCNDENACTNDDRCVDGECLGLPAPCDDGQPCTVDLCDPLAGCVAVEIHDRCDDGDPCTDDVCTATLGCRAEPKPDYSICSEPVTCEMAAICVSGLCTPFVPPDGFPCSDGNVCTLGDACQGGACVGAVTEEPPTAVGDVDRLRFLDVFDAITDDRFLGATTPGGFVVVDVQDGVPHVRDRLQMLELIEDAEVLDEGLIVGWNASGPFFLRIDDDGHLTFGGAAEAEEVRMVTGDGSLLLSCRASPGASIDVYAMTDGGLASLYEVDVATCIDALGLESLPSTGTVHMVQGGRVVEISTTAGSTFVRVHRAEAGGLVEEIAATPLEPECPDGTAPSGFRFPQYEAGRFGFEGICGGDLTATLFLFDLTDPTASPYVVPPWNHGYEILDEVVITGHGDTFVLHEGSGTDLVPSLPIDAGAAYPLTWTASLRHILTSQAIVRLSPTDDHEAFTFHTYALGFERLAVRPAGIFLLGHSGGFFATRSELAASAFSAGPEGPFLGASSAVLPVTVEGTSAGLLTGIGSGLPCSTWSYEACQDEWTALYPGALVSSATFGVLNGPLGGESGMFDPAGALLDSIRKPRARGCLGVAQEPAGLSAITLVIIDLCDTEGSIAPRGSVEVFVGHDPVTHLHDGQRVTVIGPERMALVGFDDPDAPVVLAELVYADFSVGLSGFDQVFEVYGLRRFTAGYDEGTWVVTWTRAEGELGSRTYTPELAVFSVDEAAPGTVVSRGRLDLAPAFSTEEARARSHLGVVGVLYPRAYVGHYGFDAPELLIVSVSGPAPVVDGEVDLRSGPVDLVEENGSLYVARHEGVTVVSPPCGGGAP